MSTIKIVFKCSPRFGSTDITGEIIHVNIVVGKVGPLRKIFFVPRNTKEFDLFAMTWGNRHGRPRMWPKYLMKFKLLPSAHTIVISVMAVNLITAVGLRFGSLVNKSTV